MNINRIIVVCGTLYRRNLKSEPNSCGSDICLEETIDSIRHNINRIDVISLCKDNLPSIEKFNNIYIHRVLSEDVLEKINELNIIGNTKVSYILTQLILSDLAFVAGKKLNIPVIYFLHSYHCALPIGRGKEFVPYRIITISRDVAKHAKRLYGVKVNILYPQFNNKRVIGSDEKIKFDFLMFNPNELKGGRIFFELAKRLPEYKFLAVSGWGGLKTNNNFDANLMKLMALAHGSNSIRFPKEPVPPNLKNLTIIAPEINPGIIIKMSKVLLVPSQWEEAFGRVIVEAGLNNRHVIASNKNGIPEAMNIAGMPKAFFNILLVNNYKDVVSWERAIKKYLNLKKIPTPKPTIMKQNVFKIIFNK